MNSTELMRDLLHRRAFLRFGSMGIGSVAAATLFNKDVIASEPQSPVALQGLHHPPRVKRIIYLVMSGGPSHIDLFDYKPKLRDFHGQELPASVRMGQRITGMTSGQKSFPCAASLFQFQQHGQSGAWISELLPNMARVADDLTFIKSMNTEAINHDPAFTFIQTGHQQPGRPSLGAWLSYGIGSECAQLPNFVVMISQGSGNKTDQPIFSRLWGSGFLPSRHQGVRFRSGQDAVLYLSNPPGVDQKTRRIMLDGVQELNAMSSLAIGDPEIQARMAQYEMAYRMQSSVPDLIDLSTETQETHRLYGLDRPHDDGGYARNCLLARRMIERGVRFVQLIHRGWDQHSSLPKQMRGQCLDVDQSSAALIVDLKRRGLLEDTLVIWGGEFGRTVYSQGALTKDNYGRDHHGRCFTIAMAGGGLRHGITYGETDDHCYNVTKDPVHIHDFNATVLHLLGIDHKRLTFRFQGRDFRLTDVHGEVVRGVLS